MATGELLFSFSGPVKGSYFATISPRESYLATSEIFDRQIGLWTIPSGRKVRSFAGLANGVRRVVFSHDEQRIAALGIDGRIVVWDVATAQVSAEHSIHVADFYRLDFSPTGDLIVEFDTGRRSEALAVTRP